METGNGEWETEKEKRDGPMSRRIPGPAGKLAVDDGGEGAAVVFVHSLAGNTGHWSAQLERLRHSRRAVALDLRGHGRSEPSKSGYAIDAVATDVGAVADALGLPRFALVGHSMGGGVALAYAGAHPERVDRLLLLDPIGDGTQIPTAEMQPFIDGLGSPAYQETWADARGRRPVETISLSASTASREGHRIGSSREPATGSSSTSRRK